MHVQLDKIKFLNTKSAEQLKGILIDSNAGHFTVDALLENKIIISSMNNTSSSNCKD